MNIKQLLQKYYKAAILIVTISAVISGAFIKSLGIKDTFILFLATILVISSISLMAVDRKKSILLFITSFPVLVTARKIFYFDILFIRVTYETIYILFCLITNYRYIKSFIKNGLSKKQNLHVQFFFIAALFIVFSINSSIFSNDITRSLAEVYISIVMPAALTVTVASIFTKEDIYNLYYALIVGLNFSSLYGFVQIFTNHIPLNRINYNRELLTFGYHNTNIFAGILTLIMPLLMEALLYKKNSKKEKVFLIISFAINLIALIITFTRGAWIAFIISLFILLISKRYKKAVFALLILGAVALKPLVHLIITRGTTNTSFLNSESVIARIQSAFTSIRIIFDYPFGVGGGNFAEFYKKYAEAGYMLMPQEFRWNIQVANYALEAAHNLWLQISVEFGFVSVVLFLILIINRLITAFRSYSSNRGPFVAIIMYLIFSVLTGVEFNHKGVITGTLVIWLIFAFIQLNSEGRKLNEDYN